MNGDVESHSVGPQFLPDRCASIKYQSRLHQFGKKVLPGIFPGFALFAGEVSGKKTSWSQKIILEDSMRRRSSCRKIVNISYSRSQMEQSNCLKGIRFSEIHLNSVSPCTRRRACRRPSWRVCKGNVSCTSYSRTFGYGKLRTSSRTT